MYSGTWYNDLLEGPACELAFGSGASYKGGCLNGQYEGEGVYTFPKPKAADQMAKNLTVRQARYEGAWRDGKMHGQGVYIDEEGVKFKGTFFNGLFFNGRAYVTLR